MAQLRQHYQEFVKRETEVLVVGPDVPAFFQSYWTHYKMPFPGLADPTHKVANRYGQAVKLLKFGRMPAVIVIDRAGRIRFSHYSENMRDYPTLEQMYAVLDEVNNEAKQAGTSTR